MKINKAEFGITRNGEKASRYLIINDAGMQVYSGNFLDHQKGKNGAAYPKRAGICFETQFYPNSCNEPKFPSCILEAGKTFRSRTVYKFGLENQ